MLHQSHSHGTVMRAMTSSGVTSSSGLARTFDAAARKVARRVARRSAVTSRKLQTRPTLLPSTSCGRESRSKMRPSWNSRTSWLTASGSA